MPRQVGFAIPAVASAHQLPPSAPFLKPRQRSDDLGVQHSWLGKTNLKFKEGRIKLLPPRLISISNREPQLPFSANVA